MKQAKQLQLLKTGPCGTYLMSSVASLALLPLLFGLPRFGDDLIGGIVFLLALALAGLGASCLVKAWTRVDELETRLLILATQARP